MPQKRRDIFKFPDLVFLVVEEDAALALPPLPPLLFLAEDLEAAAALFLGIMANCGGSSRDDDGGYVFLRRK